tara:strand:- start:1148 stop:1783 length:636 start_codon:yes stop_codon:yes gene_type:complete
MIWTAVGFAVTYQIFLQIPAYTLYAVAPELSQVWVMGLSYLSVGAMLFWFLDQEGVVREVAGLGDRNSTTTLATLVAVAAVYFLSTLVSDVLVATFGPEGLSISEDMQVIMRFSRPLELFFTVVLVAPLVEEFIYRGLLMGVLLERGWAPLAATGLSALIFSVQHFQYGWIGIVTVFMFAMLFGVLRVATGGLYAPILAHVICNAVSVIYW